MCCLGSATGYSAHRLSSQEENGVVQFEADAAPRCLAPRLDVEQGE